MRGSKRNTPDDDTSLVKSLSSILLRAAELRVLFFPLAECPRMLFLAMSGAGREGNVREVSGVILVTDTTGTLVVRLGD